MKKQDAIRLFGLNNLLIESEIQRIEQIYDEDLGHTTRTKEQEELDETYYPQFSSKHRKEASSMASHYDVFYCLENSIREMISQRLEEEHGEDWWEKSVPQQVRNNAKSNQKKESTTGVTLRSEELIDYTTFGELGEILKSNWEFFGDILRDSNAVVKILNNLNTLRAPIAHCTALAPDEVVRLHLSLSDWFRQME